MSDRDVSQIIQYDKSLIASDSLGCVTGKPHPRSYGTFPRLLGKYVREEKALSLEQAVRKITSFPVQRFKLGKRGLLVPGYCADLVVFDPHTIKDTATYQEPVQYPEGVSYVYVNGTRTWDLREHTKAKAGAFLPAHRCNHHGPQG
jgi:N-acyl-D-amino-acid deacylase